jgi:hypothetical protein
VESHLFYSIVQKCYSLPEGRPQLSLIHICSFKFILNVCIEESIVNPPRIRDQDHIRCLNLTLLFALFVFLVCRLTSGAFTIDFSTPTLRIHLNEHPILLYNDLLWTNCSPKQIMHHLVSNSLPNLKVLHQFLTT